MPGGHLFWWGDSMPTRRDFLLGSIGLLGLSPLQVFADPSDASRQSGSTDTRRKRLLYFTSSSCALCRSFERTELKSLRSVGWQIGPQPSNHIQVVEIERNRDVAGRYEISSVPNLVCIDFDREVRRWKGQGVFDRWTADKVYTGRYRFPDYPIRGDWWTVDETTDHTVQVMVAHMNWGSHKNKFDGRWLNELKIDELHSLHSDDHEDHVHWRNSVKRNDQLAIKPAESEEADSGDSAELDE